jgi:hypothetical protein
MPPRSRVQLRFLFLVLSSFAFAGRAGATVYVPVDFGAMVTASTFIVHGRVEEVRSEPTADRRAIATFVTVNIDRSLKGTAGTSVTFKLPGGQVGRYRRIVVGAPQFERGDEVVLFLTSRGPSIPYLFGLSQGVYRVSRRSGQPLVAPPPVAGGIGPERVVRGDPARRPLPLDDFARAIRAVLEEKR